MAGGYKEFATTETMGAVHGFARRSVLYTRLASVPIAIHDVCPIHASRPCAR
jgi:hypothetical protein